MQTPSYTELLRTTVRALIGHKSWPYRMAAFSVNMYWAARREGGPGLALLRLRHKHGADVTLRLRSLAHPITVRPGSQDVGAIMNNVVRQEYGQLDATFVPATVVDAGAYIGDTAAYFLTRFPSARVLALEPNRESYKRAYQNLGAYGDRVVLLDRALWDRETELRLSGGQTGAAITADGDHVIQTITIPEIMSRLNVDTIDLLKLDIEGAESTVVPSGVGGWLRCIRKLLLETHGAPIEQHLIPLLTKERFRCTRHRNVWYCDNLRFG